MRAVVITAPGGPEVLSVKDAAAPPTPAADRVLVRVMAAALNRADILQRMGRYPAPAGHSQEIPGLEFAGEVAAVGPEVKRWKAGDRVFGITGGGAQAEYLTTQENHLAVIPDNLNWYEAAAVPEAFITVHDAMITQAGLKIGERLLVHAAGSGVGLAALQLGKAAGATVYGTSRTSDKLERARNYGMDDGIAVGNDPAIVPKRVEELTNGKGVNVVLDLVGAAYLDATLASMAQGGRLLLVGTTSGSNANFNFGVVMYKRLKIIGTVLRARSAEEKATATRLFEDQVVPSLANGKLKPTIDSVFPVEQVRTAHERMESNGSFGKIVLDLKNRC
jgi:putative PIG3 family NAD(P)H quinone oxidoreductase